MRIGTPSSAPVTVYVDGEPLEAYEGDTVASALIAAGRSAFRRSVREKQPRGVFCGMGICFDCLVTVDGVRSVRACMTAVEPGMKIETQ